MKRFKKMSGILFLCMLVSMLAMPVSAKAAALNRKSITLNVGKSYKLKAKGIKRKITWTSSKKSVATVSKTGVVEARKKGTAVITAKYGKKKLTCKVTVKKPVKGVKSYFKSVDLNMSNFLQYFAPEIVRSYDSTWGDPNGYRIFWRAKDLNGWYLFSTKNFAVEYNIQIDYDTEDGRRTMNRTTESNFLENLEYDLSSVVITPTRAKGTLTFIKKDAITKIQYRNDETLKRRRVSNCKLIKELDNYMMKNYYEKGLNFMDFFSILLPFE